MNANTLNLPEGEVDTLIENLGAVTPTVLAAFSRIEDKRLRTVVASFISHLHACVLEVKLTPTEFEGALDFMNKLAHVTSRKYNGAMALSDMLGISTLVCMVNDMSTTDGDYRTARSVLGPLWRQAAPEVTNGDSIVRSDTAGEPLFVTGHIVNTRGEPIAGVTVHIWHATPYGRYENQDDDQAEMNLRGRLTSDSAGEFRFRTVLPGGYPVSGTEPIATLVRVAKRNPFRPAHLHFLMHHPGLQTLVTQIFSPYCPHLHRDAVFGVTRELLGDFVKHTEGPKPAPDVGEAWHTLDHRFVMADGPSELPQAPID